MDSVAGFDSRVISASSSMLKFAFSSLIILAIWSLLSSDGVPPPKKMVSKTPCAWSLISLALMRISSHSAFT